MYILSKTSEVLNIGDTIVLDLTKDLPVGNVEHHHIECKFIPQLIPLLLEQGIIEEVEEKKSPKASECRMTYTLQELVHINKALSAKVETLSTRVDTLEQTVKKVVAIVGTLKKVVAALNGILPSIMAFITISKGPKKPQQKENNKKPQPKNTNHSSGKQKD